MKLCKLCGTKTSHTDDGQCRYCIAMGKVTSKSELRGKIQDLILIGLNVATSKQADKPSLNHFQIHTDNIKTLLVTLIDFNNNSCTVTFSVIANHAITIITK